MTPKAADCFIRVLLEKISVTRVGMKNVEDLR